MKRRVLPVLAVAALLAFPASVARADGALNLAWTNCYGDGTPVSNMVFACNSNSGSHALVASIVAPTGATQLTGVEIFLDLVSMSAPMGNWWALFNAGSCRATSLTTDFVYGGSGPGCRTLWTAPPASGGIFSYSSPGFIPVLPSNVWSQHSEIDIATTMPPAAPLAMTPGSEYFIANVRIDNALTTGTGACAGCTDPVCIAFTYAILSQASGNVLVNTSSMNSAVTWQGTGADCGSVPVRKATWGAIKSLYR